MKEVVRDVAPATRDTFVEKHGDCEVYAQIIEFIETRAYKITNILFSKKGGETGE